MTHLILKRTQYLFDEKISFLERQFQMDESRIIDKSIITNDQFTRSCLIPEQIKADIIPMFTRCQSFQLMQQQRELFQNDCQIVRCCIIHVQSMIYDNMNTEIVQKFMKSIYIVKERYTQKILLDNNPEIQAIYKHKVTKNPLMVIDNLSLFVQYWDMAYNGKLTLPFSIVNDKGLEQNQLQQWYYMYSFIRQIHYNQMITSNLDLSSYKFNQSKSQQITPKKLFDNYKIIRIKIQICKIRLPNKVTRKPNQDIIIGKMTDNYLPIDNKYEIFYNYVHTFQMKQLQIWFKKIYQEYQQIIFVGSLDLQSLQCGNGFLQLGEQLMYEGQFREGVFQGYGKLTMQHGYLEGDFNNGYAHGKCSDKYGTGDYYYNTKHGKYIDNNNRINYYEDGQLVNYQVQPRDVQAMLLIANSNQNYIDIYCLRTLLPNSWLQMKIVDYYLDAIQIQQNIPSIRIINTCECQDMFGNFTLRPDSRSSIKRINTIPYKRIILVLNVNRSHFITIAYENQQFYVFDSLGFDYFGQLSNLQYVMDLTRYTIKINTASQIPQLKQNNSYDCGLYALYNAFKLYTKNSINQIQFDKEGVNMRTIRKHLRSILIDDYKSLNIL